MSHYPAVRRKSFWFEEPWPRDAPDGSFVFLGRAVREVGKALFPDSWSDDDPKLAFSNREALHAERERVKEVMETLGVAIARGDVGFALRPDKGGEFKPQKEALQDGRDRALVQFGKANWNVDDFTDHFKFAQMNDGIFRPEQVPPLDWIYLERQTFDHFIAGVSSDQDPWGHPLNLDLPDFRDGRDELIAAVESGSMFLPEAERLAAEKGLRPLQVIPDSHDLAIMDMPDWTMEMVFAWVIWRKPGSVLQFYKPYDDAISSPQSPFGSIPQPTLDGIKEAMELDAQLASFGDEVYAVPSWEQVSRQVLEALRAGKIAADATNLASMKSTDISNQEWKRLRPTSDVTGATILVNNFNSPIYGDVMFEREKVLVEWPPLSMHREAEQHAETTAINSPSISHVAEATVPTMLDLIRAVGMSKLSPSERQIWKAIEAIGGENALPPRRVDYKELIKNKAQGTHPSDSSIDRFFARFKPTA